MLFVAVIGDNCCMLVLVGSMQGVVVVYGWIGAKNKVVVVIVVFKGNGKLFLVGGKEDCIGSVFGDDYLFYLLFVY